LAQHVILSIQYVSPSLSLSQLGARLGLSPARGSHSRGDARSRGEPFDHSLLRLDLIPDWTEFDESAILPRLRLLEASPSEPEIQATLCVALLSDTFTTTFQIPASVVREATRLGLAVEVAVYPCDSPDEATPLGPA
jgi:hypothetical protein